MTRIEKKMLGVAGVVIIALVIFVSMLFHSLNQLDREISAKGGIRRVVKEAFKAEQEKWAQP